METNSVDSKSRSLFLINIGLLYFPTFLLLPVFLGFLANDEKIRVHPSILLIHVLLFTCALGMTFFLNKNIKTIRKDNDENFLSYFFKGNDTRFSFNRIVGTILDFIGHTEEGCSNSAPFISSMSLFGILPLLMSTCFISISNSIFTVSIYHFIYVVAMDILMLILIALIIVGGIKYLKIYGKKKKKKKKK